MERSEVMELLTIVVMNPTDPYVSSLSQFIYAELQRIHKDPDVFQLRNVVQGQYAQISVHAAITAAERRKMQDRIHEGIGFALADHIISEHEPKLLRDLIRKALKPESESDMVLIEGYCKQFLNGEGETGSGEEFESRRKMIIADLVQVHVRDNSLMNLDGFIRFRLQEYMEELREIVEYALDEYMMDRQYQEFISLLKYFVYIQEAKIPTAHLIHKGGHEFVILGDSLEEIDTNEFDSSFKLEALEKDINFEDMIVSTLITVSPANIHIHTREPNMPIINTIVQIFEDRTSICSYCRTCHTYLGEAVKQDQLSP